MESSFRVPREKGLGGRHTVDRCLDQVGGRLEH